MPEGFLMALKTKIWRKLTKDDDELWYFSCGEGVKIGVDHSGIIRSSEGLASVINVIDIDDQVIGQTIDDFVLLYRDTTLDFFGYCHLDELVKSFYILGMIKRPKKEFKGSSKTIKKLKHQ